MQTVTFDYSPELVKQVTRRFIMHHLKRQFFWVGVIGLFGIITLLAGERGFFQGASVTFFLIFLFTWFNYYRNAYKLAQELPNRSVTVIFDDEGVTFQTMDHTSIVKWPRVKEILKLNEAWFFFIYSNNNFTMVPTSLLDDDLKAFIEQKMIDHGGQIVYYTKSRMRPALLGIWFVMPECVYRASIGRVDWIPA